MTARFSLLVNFFPIAAVFLFTASLSFANPIPKNADTVTVGFLRTNDPFFFIDTFGPTMAFLRKRMKGTEIRSKELALSSLLESIKNKKIDYVIVPGGVYAYLERAFGARLLASFSHRRAINSNESSGAVIIARKSDDRYQEVADIKNAKIAANDKESFEEWLVPVAEAINHGLTFRQLVENTVFTDYKIPDVPTLVASGVVDIGFMAVCRLEDLISQKAFSENTFKVIGRKKDNLFGCARSTDLYPGYVFASLPTSNLHQVKEMTIGLLSMNNLESGSGWEVANDFSKAISLYEKLGLEPFVKPITWQDFLRKYSLWLFGVFSLLALLVLHTLRTEALVTKRTAELSTALRTKNELERQAKESQEKILQLERSGVISQMSGMLAHEVRQPVESLLNYTAGLKMYLEKKGKSDEIVDAASEAISSEAKRISGIVGRVRQYAKNSKKELEIIRVSDLIDSALRTFSHSPKSSGIRFVKNVEKGLYIEADPLEIELVLINLFRNASEAMQNEEEKKIEIQAKSSANNKVIVAVTDSGPTLPQENKASLMEPLKSTKKDGLGIGLSLCRQILVGLGGRLDFEPGVQKGLRALITLPRIEKYD